MQAVGHFDMLINWEMHFSPLIDTDYNVSVCNVTGCNVTVYNVKQSCAPRKAVQTQAHRVWLQKTVGLGMLT